MEHVYPGFFDCCFLFSKFSASCAMSLSVPRLIGASMGAYNTRRKQRITRRYHGVHNHRVASPRVGFVLHLFSTRRYACFPMDAPPVTSWRASISTATCRCRSRRRLNTLASSLKSTRISDRRAFLTESARTKVASAGMRQAATFLRICQKFSPHIASRPPPRLVKTHARMPRFCEKHSGQSGLRRVESPSTLSGRYGQRCWESPACRQAGVRVSEVACGA